MLELKAEGNLCYQDISLGLFTINIVLSVAKIKLLSDNMSPDQIYYDVKIPEEMSDILGVDKS